MDRVDGLQMDLPEETIYGMLQEVYEPSYAFHQERRGEASLEGWLVLRLLQGISIQLKKGLYKTYISVEAPLTQIRGKVDMHQSIKLRTELSRQLYCQYDLFDQDNLYNQIIKATCLYVLRQGRMSQELQKELKKVLLKLQAIHEMPLRAVSWQSIRFHKDKIAYRRLIGICYILVKGLSISTEDGRARLHSEILMDLYEQFVESFYSQRVSDVFLGEREFSGESGFMRKSCHSKDHLLRRKKQMILLRSHLWNKSMLEKENEVCWQKELKGLREEVERQGQKTEEDVKGILMIPYWMEGEHRILQGEQIGKLKIYALNLNAPFNQIEEQLREAIL